MVFYCLHHAKGVFNAATLHAAKDMGEMGKTVGRNRAIKGKTVNDPTLTYVVLDTETNEIFQCTRAEHAEKTKSSKNKRRYKDIGYFRDEAYARLFSETAVRGYSPDYYTFLQIENTMLKRIVSGELVPGAINKDEISELAKTSIELGGARKCIGMCESSSSKKECQACFASDPSQWMICANVTVAKSNA